MKTKTEFKNTSSLAVKDLATIGIFSAIMIVVFIAFSIITGASLFFNMIFNAVFVSFILAPFYVYMCMKVGKPGIALIYNLIHALLVFFMMGPFISPWFIVGGIIAELSMLGKNSYRSITRISISWAITMLVRATHGMAEIWFFKNAYMGSGVSSEQIAIQTKYYTSLPWVLLSCTATIIMSILGCMLANKIIAKHFRKSGLIN
ncbi:MptD family putative ECF transporter S component [Clostridium sp. MSJ-4]|uniref:MptD family putative ECF transporter S component n=1 Tax=Clostridium simiarum TaxID=2841506 RepID=A0ABS6EZB5_9CLOT|nr:MptD family putative ECF transporter S component [Clostridium simiarum]MBU5591584.1 MptD family putative ECF transporter S component [Clostridium simiarum]